MPASYDRLSTQDSSFIYFEGPGTHMHVSAVATFAPREVPEESRLDIHRLRDHVASRLHLLPRYRQRLDFTPLQRHPIWVDDARFNLVYHVRHTALPAPGTEAQLKELAGRIVSQQLDREKPLWEMWLVEGLEGGRAALVFKIHHAMVDGVAGVSLLTALLSASPDDSAEPVKRWTPRPRPGRAELLVDELRHRASAPLSALRAIRSAVGDPGQASTQVFEGADAMWQALNAGLRRPSNTPFNRPIGTHRRLEWCWLELSEVKELKKRLDGSVNDVVLAVVTGAMRRFLAGRRQRLRDLEFRVVVPVNMRDTSDTSPGNRVSAWFLSLPVSERDPARRFALIREQTARLKGSRAAQGIDLLTRFTEWSGSDLLTYWGTRFASTLRPYNMIVTNVPGPHFPLYLLGARLEHLYPQLPLFEHQGLGVAVLSYLGKVGFGAIADWDLVSDLGRFPQAIEASFEELRGSGRQGGVRS
jgi:WS/DGAT/MGAT family acyltransferase